MGPWWYSRTHSPLRLEFESWPNLKLLVAYRWLAVYSTELYVLVSSAHKATHHNITYTVLNFTLNLNKLNLTGILDDIINCNGKIDLLVMITIFWGAFNDTVSIVTRIWVTRMCVVTIDSNVCTTVTVITFLSMC